jgi:phage-related minor tail protein
VSSDIMDRVRKVDIEQLTEEQVSELTIEMSKIINSIVDEACAKANSLLNIYGLETQMQIVIKKKD